MKMTNDRNVRIYRRWAPIYDKSVDRLFRPGRRRAIQLLDLKPGERVLIPGVGTGADLPLLPAGVEATGIDLSPEMLAKAHLKLDYCAAAVKLIEGDAQALLVEPASYDAAILNLILSVIPDGNTCLQSALRALKPDGRVVVFDKFLPEGGSVSSVRKVLNFFSTRFGTDINRRFSELIKGCPCAVTHDEPSILGGMYRVILLKKIS
ncbi:MAG TPA: methyltransferase domain-containing protein [Anaerolineales bacterium]|nr:methyltransferase domain-containing protein [Anaerolineales bacterium]